MDVISQSMRVPEHLGVSPRHQWQREEDGDVVPSLFTMQVPDRLTYTEAADMSPGPLFKQDGTVIRGTLNLDPCWEPGSGGMFCLETLQSPMRRSYSDQSFSRTPPETPSPLKQALVVPRAPSNPSGSGLVVRRQENAASFSSQTTDAPPLSFLSFDRLLAAAKQLARRASERLLQMLVQRYRFGNNEKLLHPGRTGPKVPASVVSENSQVMDAWSPVEEEEGGAAAVEVIILRRQVMKMNRRLAALEKNNTERRSTEVLLFSVIVSACLLNTWLWIRR